MTRTLILLLSCATICEASSPSVDFDTQIMPVLTKAGCNAGACHGAAAGRGGFHISLYGSDPAADFAAITQQWEGRRINLSHPERSLFLRKPTADMDHGGDERFSPGSDSADLILRWISGGAERVRERTLTSVTVKPSQATASNVGDTITVSVSAAFDDQSAVDVTQWSVIRPEDPASLEVTDEGQVTVKRRGSHLLLVRYLDRILPVSIVLPYQDSSPAIDSADDNPIDHHVISQLNRLGLSPSSQADDATFVRRITLDLTGRLPAPEAAETFVASTAKDKRAALIDDLLSSEDFVDYWTFEFAKLLRLRPIGNDRKAAEVFHAWVREQLEQNRPFDEIARQLLSATGDSHEIGPASFHRVVGGPREQAEFVSELFMGVRLRCANCHDHPLDRWTQDDYHGLSAIFARLQRGKVVSVGERGEVSHPKTQEAAVPRLPGTRFVSAEDDARPTFADWLTSSDNSYFARAIVNRLWRQLMGRGLVEPVDDLRATNPGTHPELLDWLAADFIDHGYDLRHTIRLIATSAAYQRSSQPSAENQIDDRFYSHYLSEPLEPEVLADAVADVTGVAFQYGDEPAGTRAISLLDPKAPSTSLDLLGRCGREEGCETAGSAAGGVAVKLHLLNGPFLNDAIAADEGRLRQVMEDHSPAAIVHSFYLRALSRPQTGDEQQFWAESFADLSESEQLEVAEDFLWSLLTSREFTTNH